MTEISNAQEKEHPMDTLQCIAEGQAMEKRTSMSFLNWNRPAV